jgi:hypothetical protein
VRDFTQDIRDKGAELVLVGSGTPLFAHAFRRELGLEAERLLLDPDLTAYEAAGLHRSVAATLLSTDSYLAAIRAFRKGFRQGSTQGDPWQQGGTFVVLPDGTVPFAHVNKNAGDHADLRRAVACLGVCRRKIIDSRNILKSHEATRP